MLYKLISIIRLFSGHTRLTNLVVMVGDEGQGNPNNKECGSYPGTIPDAGNATITCSASAVGRYVSIKLTVHDVLTLCEVEVEATAGDCQGDIPHSFYLYFFLRTYINTEANTYTSIYIHTYIDTYIHTCKHTYIHTDRQTYIHTHTYIHTGRHTYIDIHILTYTYIYTYIHTYIHTRIGKHSEIKGPGAKSTFGRLVGPP